MQDTKSITVEEVKPVVSTEPTVQIPQRIVDSFVKAATKLELTLAKEELLKFIR